MISETSQLGVLLVSGETDMDEVLGNALSEYLHDIYVAGDEISARDQYLKHQKEIDLILLDSDLLQRQSRKLFLEDDHTVPIFLLLGEQSSGVLFDAMELGINRFLKKPLDIGFLTTVFAKLSQSKSLRYKQNMIQARSSMFWEMMDSFSILSMTDSEGVITYVNDAFCDVTGYAREELIGQPHSVIRHPDNPPEFFKAMWNQLAEGEPWHEIIKNRTKGGDACYMDTLIYPMMTRPGTNEGYISIRHDLTRQVQSEMKARQESQRLLALFEATPDILMLTDGNKVFDVNRSFLAFFSEFDSLDAFRQQHECVCDYFEKEAGYLSASMAGENWLTYILSRPEAQHKAKIVYRGIPHIFLVKAAQIATAGSEYIVIFNDISELEAMHSRLERKVVDEIRQRKEQEQLLERSSRLALMGEMISMIAHQWRQPLANITAITGGMTMGLLMGEVPEPEYLHDKINEIESTAQHLSKTIEDFRNFFKPDKQLNETNIYDLYRQGVAMLQGPIRTHGIDIVYECDEALATYTHQRELLQVFMNIIKNAIDALADKKPENPTIVLSCRRSSDMVHMVMTDNAGGIPADIIEKIFDPYFSTKGNVGTGLGLYMSKMIIESHCDGVMNVHNGVQGAEFMINIPIITKEAHGNQKHL